MTLAGATLLSSNACIEVRYSFTHQYLDGAQLFALDAALIENSTEAIASETIVRHRALVTSSIIQSIAALESEAFEILTRGPGHHKGSNGINKTMGDFLRPLENIIDKLPVLERFENILHLTNKPALNRGASAFQNMDLAIKLRNEIVHYKSKWEDEFEQSKFFTQLQSKRFRCPPFISKDCSFFPHQVLGSDCAQWCVKSVIIFLSEFYHALGFPCRMTRYNQFEKG